MPASYIPDGYTREKQIGTADGDRTLHIAWRPMLAAERRRLNLQTVRLSSGGSPGLEEAARRAVAAVTSRLVDWDVTDAAGRAVEISPAALAALEPGLFEKLYSTVTTFPDEEGSAKN
jgi:hypothetical protein